MKLKEIRKLRKKLRKIRQKRERKVLKEGKRIRRLTYESLCLDKPWLMLADGLKFNEGLKPKIVGVEIYDKDKERCLCH